MLNDVLNNYILYIDIYLVFTWFTNGHSEGKNVIAVCNAFASQISEISLSISPDLDLVFINLNSVPTQKYPTVSKTIFSRSISFDNSWFTLLLIESTIKDQWRSSKL